MTEYQKAQPKDLPCIFANLVDVYTNKDLKPCATKSSQKWHYASSNAAAEKLLIYHNYIPELVPLHSSLDFYSICEVHYNQVIVSNKFYQAFLNLDTDTSVLRKKRSHGDDKLKMNPNTSSRNVDKNYIDATSSPIQFNERKFTDDESVSMEEFQRTKRLLELRELECCQKSQVIIDLNNKITQQSHQSDQNHEIE